MDDAGEDVEHGNLAAILDAMPPPYDKALIERLFAPLCEQLNNGAVPAAAQDRAEDRRECPTYGELRSMIPNGRGALSQPTHTSNAHGPTRSSTYAVPSELPLPASQQGLRASTAKCLSPYPHG